MIIVGYSDLLVDIGKNGIMFLPQEPYLTSGSLAEQVNIINIACSNCLNPEYKSPHGYNTHCIIVPYSFNGHQV